MYYALNNLEGGCGGLKQTVLHYLPLSSRKLSFFFKDPISVSVKITIYMILLVLF